MNAMPTPVKLGTPPNSICDEHRVRLGSDGACPRCTAREDAAYVSSLEERERFQRYRGDAFLVDSLVAEGLDKKDAIAEVQDGRHIAMVLELCPEYIQKDQHIRKALLAMAWRTVNGERGPKKNPITRKFKEQYIADLRAEGKTLGQIALIVYHDKTKRNTVAATLSNWKKKQVAKTAPKKSSR